MESLKVGRTGVDRSAALGITDNMCAMLEISRTENDDGTAEASGRWSDNEDGAKVKKEKDVEEEY